MHKHLERLSREIAAATDGISGEQLICHPPGKWCVAEVLEHLYLTYTGTIKGFERVIEAGKPLVKARTFKDRFGVLLVIGVGYLPSGRKAPPVALPRGVPAETVMSEIGPKVAEMDQTIARCEEKFGRGKLLDHPILGPLSGAEWRKFHLVHGLHHVKKIKALRRAGSSQG